MTLRSIPVQALAQRLSLKEDTLKQWMSSLSIQGSRDQGGVLTLDPWEAEYLSQAKDFYIGYQRDFDRVREALQRWASRHPRPEPPALSPDDDLLDPRSSSDSELPALPSLPPDLLQASPPKSKDGMERSAQPSTPPPPRRINPRDATPLISVTETSQIPTQEDLPKETLPQPTPISQSTAEATSIEEVNRWKSHFQNAQRDLRRVQEELDRAREKNQQQHAVIKQLQADFNALKELIRKEIYDLRDLVVDKNKKGS